MSKTELFARKQPGGMFAVVNEGMTTGDIWFVDSGSANGKDAAGYGQNPDAPFLTLDYADSACTANNGDRIYVMAGHAESFAALAGFSLSHAGVEVIGLGQGADRPTFTFTATDAVCTITGASITLKNVVLVSAIDSIVAPLTVSGADCLLERVEWRDTTNIEFISGLITTAAADRLTIRDCFYNGYLAGNACTSAFWIVGANGLTIEDCRFFGLASTAFVDFETTLCDKVLVRRCTFYNAGTALTRNVVATIAACKWVVADCYDVEGGYMFEGGSGIALAAASYTSVTLANDAITAAKIAADAIGAAEIANGAIDAATFAADAIDAAAIATGAIVAATFAAGAVDAAAIATNAIDADALAADAVAEIADGIADEALAGHLTANTVGNAMACVEKCCEKSDGAVLLGDDPIFTIAGGPIEILEIVGIVTTVIGGGETNVKLELDTTSPAATVELNAGAVDIDSDAAGTSYRSINTTGIFTPVTAGFVLEANSFATNPTTYFAPAGTIQFNSDAARDGVIKWYLRYKPLSPNSVVTAAA